MVDLPALSSREVIRAFERAGYVVVRHRGSHAVMEKKGALRRLTIPTHAGKTIKIGLLLGLLEDAGLTREQFVELL